MSQSIKSFFKPVAVSTAGVEKKEKVQSESGKVEDELLLGKEDEASNQRIVLGKRKIEDATDLNSECERDAVVIRHKDEKQVDIPPTSWIPIEQLRSWIPILKKEFYKPYFSRLDVFLEREASSKTIYPPRQMVFSAFSECNFEDIKVVIIGQDPYHGPNQAHGLAFSVMKPERPPPSLKNIFKEVKSDIPSFSTPSHGDLSGWSKKGVFLLNTCLTVQRGNANSHQKKGWEEFITAVIKAIDQREDGVVFLLWGKPASERCAHINRKKHPVISSSHPSPLGASKTNAPFLGSKCFSRCNEALIKMGKEPIDWNLE